MKNLVQVGILHREPCWALSSLWITVPWEIAHAVFKNRIVETSYLTITLIFFLFFFSLGFVFSLIYIISSVVYCFVVLIQRLLKLTGHFLLSVLIKLQVTRKCLLNVSVWSSVMFLKFL